jgi:kynurenine formamidase
MTRWTHSSREAALLSRRNWGRWGDDDQCGAVNLIDETKRIAAAQLVRSGRTFSLSGPVVVEPTPENLWPALHFGRRRGSVADDFLNLPIHSVTNTHIDALNHLWEADGMWNGRDPRKEFDNGVSHWADITSWGDGIVTRGVVFDVPGARGTECVTLEAPLTGEELERIAGAQDITPEPGDALIIYCGRDAWEERNDGSWLKWDWSGSMADSNYSNLVRPGLHFSCLEYIRDTDAAVVIWDMWDAVGHEHDGSDEDGSGQDGSNHYMFPVHAVIWAFGVALIDAAQPRELVHACRESNRFECMVVAAPLKIPGGTGSPINPIAII